MADERKSFPNTSAWQPNTVRMLRTISATTKTSHKKLVVDHLVHSESQSKRFPSKEISVGSASVLRPQAKPGAKVPCRKCSQTLSMLQRHPHCNPLVGLLGILKLPCSERVTTNKVHTSKASTNVAHVLLIRFKTTRILLQFVLPSQVYVTVVLS